MVIQIGPPILITLRQVSFNDTIDMFYLQQSSYNINTSQPGLGKYFGLSNPINKVATNDFYNNTFNLNGLKKK